MRLAMIAAVLVVAGAPAAEARGLFPSEPPWHRPTLADTTLALEFGVTSAHGDTSGYLLGAALAPVRRGPIRLGFSLDYVSVRTAAGRRFGFGDPKVFARLRLAGGRGGGFGLHAEGMARIPLADPEFYPYAHGGQEIELSGTVGVPGRWLAGCGYNWSEPPSGGGLGTSDLPHALHVLLLAGQRFGDVALRARGDAYWMENGRERGRAEAGLTWLATDTLQPTLVVGFGIGPDDERVCDAYVALRFATRLR